jgi:hypothetical protein
VEAGVYRELRPSSVYVVDIRMLTDRAKKLVFGRAVRELGDLMESEEKELDAIVVFVDELNKFASSPRLSVCPRLWAASWHARPPACENSLQIRTQFGHRKHLAGGASPR